jgi:GMP synthase (glutamine-hydrolysing)
MFVQHVPWETPHRIAATLAPHFPARTVSPLDGQALLPPQSLAAAVLMGGPMGVGDAPRMPGLLTELRWIESALEQRLPLLGVCLGSQLIAHVLGAPVQPAAEPELGWHPIEVHDSEDPLLAPLAPVTTVLHWHGEEFPVPPGAGCLASSARTGCQAFRAANAWGVLFHPEADEALLGAWLREPTMVREATAALGEQAIFTLLDGAAAHGLGLSERSSASFEAFARVIGDRAAPDPAAQRGGSPRRAV